MQASTNHLAFSGSFSRISKQHVVGVDAFGLGFEIHDHAMPQRRQINAAHVFEADVVAAFEQRPHFGGQRQRLRSREGWRPSGDIDW